MCNGVLLERQNNIIIIIIIIIIILRGQCDRVRARQSPAAPEDAGREQRERHGPAFVLRSQRRGRGRAFFFGQL